jgi:hypothetical protein
VLAGVTPGQVNKWCRGRAAVPVWAGVIAVVLRDRSPEARTIDLEETHQALAATRTRSLDAGANATSQPEARTLNRQG